MIIAKSRLIMKQYKQFTEKKSWEKDLKWNDFLFWNIYGRIKSNLKHLSFIWWIQTEFAMYYPKGWPRLLRLPQHDDLENPHEIQHVVCNRDKILTALVTRCVLTIFCVLKAWFFVLCFIVLQLFKVEESLRFPKTFFETNLFPHFS